MRFVLAILGLVPISFLIAFVSTMAMRRIAPQLGFVDRPGGRKIHAHPKPLGGGVAIFLGFAVPVLLGLAVIQLAPAPHVKLVQSATARAVPAYWSGVRDRTPVALEMLGAALLMQCLGLWDDRKALGPYVKLVIQLSIIAGLVWLNPEIRVLVFLGDAASAVLTVLWIATVTNAFNFLDNMDGLSAGVAAVCTAAFLVATLSIHQWFVAASLALLLGSLLGFLCFNFAPASIFMGDSGSLVIGLVLGTLTVRTTFVANAATWGAGWYPIFAPVIVLAVPLYDLIVVSCLRLMRGKSPFVGDTNHFSHRLVARGMSRRTAVLCLYLITAGTAIAAIILAHAPSTFVAVCVFVQTVLILGVVMLLEQHPLPAPRPEGAPQRPAFGDEAAPLPGLTETRKSAHGGATPVPIGGTGPARETGAI